MNKKSRWYLWLLSIVISMAVPGCGLFSSATPAATPEATLTPTEIIGRTVYTVTPEPNPCENVSGYIELQLLIGPSEAVGLDPYAMADIPFVVTSNNGVFLVEGGGPVQYYEDVYEAKWGSFTVKFEGDTSVTGECVSNGDQGTLNVIIEMVGSQTVEVVAEGMTTTYPWEGSPHLEASFPLLDGAQQSGEGWLLILHLN